MGDRLLAVLVIAAVAVVVGAVMWALLAYTRRLDGRTAGKGNAQASGSPEPPIWPQDRATDITYHAYGCGAHGPAGMVCDREPHVPSDRHEQGGIGWRGGAR